MIAPVEVEGQPQLGSAPPAGGNNTTSATVSRALQPPAEPNTDRAVAPRKIPSAKPKLAYARQLAEQELKVFPVIPNSKLPAIKEWPSRATTDADQISSWWQENSDYNIGVSAEGLMIVDVDIRKEKQGDVHYTELLDERELFGETVPPTFAVTTQSGGTHYYFKTDTPVGNSVSKIARGVDIRGHGGYVLGPGSTINGRPYVAGDYPIAEAPEWFVQLARTRRKRSELAGQRLTPESEEALADAEKYIREYAPEATEGERNNVAFRVAAKMFDKGLEIPSAAVCLHEWNGLKCTPPLDDDEIETIVESAARSRRLPIGIDSPTLPLNVPEEVDLTEGGKPVEGAPNYVAPVEAHWLRGVTDPWGIPDDLWAGDGSPPELPTGVVPKIVEHLARDWGRRLGVEAGAPAAALITALGALVSAGNVMQLRQKDTKWKVKPILWTAIVGEPGSNKSATISQAIEPVEYVEGRWRGEYAAAKDAAKAQSAAAKAKSVTASSEAPLGAAEELFDGAAAATPIAPFPQKIVNDTTIEALAHILAEQPSGVLCHVDELAGLIGSMDAYRQKGGKDRSFWLEAKEGKPRTINRATGTRRIFVPNNAVSVLGGIQPSKIRALAANLAEDGLLQRFAPILIDRRGSGVDDYPDEEAETQLRELAVAIADRSEKTKLFKFEPAADAELHALEAFKTREIGRPNTAPALRQWLDKLPSEFGRVALAFHQIEWHASHIGQPETEIPTLVSHATARRARRYLTEFVFPNARAFYERVVGQSIADEHARWIAGFILSRGMRVIDARDIYKNYGPLKNSERRGEIPAIMYGLEMQDWVKPTGQGQRGEPNKWAVNPAVHVQFAERAAEERARRSGIRAMIAQEGAERAAA